MLCMQSHFDDFVEVLNISIVYKISESEFEDGTP